MAYFLFFFLLQILVLISDSKANKISTVIVFGDSSVDSSNNNFIPTIAKANFKPYGRDFLGHQLKPIVPAYLDPNHNISDFFYGVCFASPGRGYDIVTSHILKLKDAFGDEKANETISEALYLVSMGTNNFLENYYALPGQKLRCNVQQYEDFWIGLVGDFINELYVLGARKISPTGAPPMGCLPLERATNVEGENACVEEYNNVAQEFNEKLKLLVGKLNGELVGCCGTGKFEMGYMCNIHCPLTCADCPLTCADVDKYVFWDAFHPSQKTSRIISYNMLNTSLARFL
ncbi:hypothetical protein UlMin_022699 [Ulmus minor]